MVGQKERLDRELEHLKKTYRSGIVDEKEFLRGKERIEKKIRDLKDKAVHDEKGKKIISDILDEKPAKEPEKPSAKDIHKNESGKAASRQKLAKEKKAQEESPVAAKEPIMVNHHRKDEDEEESSGWMLYLLIGIFLLIILILLAFSENSPFSGCMGAEPQEDLKVELYCDFTCTHCRELDTTMIALKQEYGSNITIVYRHFLLDEENYLPAVAAECAGTQNRFNSYKEKMLAMQDNLNHNSLVNIAWSLGMNITQFQECLASDAVKAKVLRISQEAGSRGVDQVPTVYIGKLKIEGAKSVSVYEQEIDKLLGR